jgi:hypothetical protein
MSKDRKDDPHLMFDRNFNPKINDKNLQPGTYIVHPDGSLTQTTPTRSSPMKRLRKDPLEGHPRATETRQAMLEARIDDAQEVMDLQASELACAVADGWVDWRRANSKTLGVDRTNHRTAILFDILDRLELVTRPSALRKMRR